MLRWHNFRMNKSSHRWTTRTIYGGRESSRQWDMTNYFGTNELIHITWKFIVRSNSRLFKTSTSRLSWLPPIRNFTFMGTMRAPELSSDEKIPFFGNSELAGSDLPNIIPQEKINKNVERQHQEDRGQRNTEICLTAKHTSNDSNIIKYYMCVFQNCAAPAIQTYWILEKVNPRRVPDGAERVFARSIVVPHDNAVGKKIMKAYFNSLLRKTPDTSMDKKTKYMIKKKTIPTLPAVFPFEKIRVRRNP